MKKFSRRKIALALACTSIFGGKTQAMNISKVQNPQTIGAVGGARNQPKKINWGKITKISGFTVAGLAALETIHSLIGGLTDSKLGSYSIGRAIRNYVKKNEQHEPAKPDGNVDINQAQVNPKKETIQVQNPINANPISVPVPVPVAKVEPKQESIIEKNIAKIKLGSDKEIADKTFKLFFDKVKIILDNKDKLVANMVTKVSEFDGSQFREMLLSEDEYYDAEKYAGVLDNEDVQSLIKQVVNDTIESLYTKEVDAYSHLSVYSKSLDLSLGGNTLISISKDGKTLYLSNYSYSIQFNASDLGIGKLEY